MHNLRLISCIRSDFEKDKLFLTKRASRCRSVWFQRATCALMPLA